MAEVLTTKTIAAGRRVRPVGVLNRIRLALDLWSERRTLDTLDARMLEDIGLERWQAEREAAKSLWDVPLTRLVSEERYRLWDRV